MHCMYCGHFKIHKRGKTIRGKEKYQRYFCDKCRKSFSELAGTIYEDRRLTPTDIDEILECQNQGMNFTQSAKKVGVTPKAVSNLLKNTYPRNPNQLNDWFDPVDSPPDTNTNDD